MNTLVFGVGVAEFDQKVGNSLTLQYPENVFQGFDIDGLANMCLPDGAHIHKEDWTYAILEKPTTTNNNNNNTTTTDSLAALPQPKSIISSSSTVGQSQPDRFLYAIAVFRNLLDPTLPRGALQKSFLVISHFPFFNLFEPLMKAALVRIMEGKDRSAPRVFYEELNTTYQKKLMQVHLWNESSTLSFPVLGADEFGGSSLRALVKTFGVNTMYIWYSLLMEERILFCGQPARTVGRCALSAPLLAYPLTGFKKLVTPYVTLMDMRPLAQKTYICGTTNLLLEMRSEMYDTLGNVSSASVVSQNPGVKIMGADKTLIKSVLAGIEDGKGEVWVREQFRRYNEMILDGLRENKLKMDQHRRLLTKLKDSQMYRDYEIARATVPEATNQETFMDHLAKLRGHNVDALTALDRPKVFYLLDKTLVDLPDIEEVIGNGGLEVVEAGLQAEGAQIRKYAVNILAKLAMNIRGQISIVSGMRGDLLHQVITMVKDPMPNVAIAACSCLVRISKLYIGASALLNNDVVGLMVSIICDPNQNLTLKIQAATVLVQIYNFYPATPRPDSEPFVKELTVQDDKYRGLLTQLLDIWGIDLSDLVPTAEFRNLLGGLQVPNLAHRAQATAYIQSTLVTYYSKSVELTASDGVKTILANADAADADHELTRLSISVLVLVADTHTGACEILRLKVVEWAVKKLKNRITPLVRAAYILRLLMVACQRPEMCLRFFCCGGVETVLNILLMCQSNMDMLSLMRPCVDTLKYALLNQPHVRAAVNSDVLLGTQAPNLSGVLNCCENKAFRGAIAGLVASAESMETAYQRLQELESMVLNERDMRCLRMGLTEVGSDQQHKLQPTRRRETIDLGAQVWVYNQLYTPPPNQKVPSVSEVEESGLGVSA